MKPNTIILIIATLIVMGGAYWYFFTGTGNDQPLSAVSVSTGSEAQFETLVNQLQPISFDTGIFSDSRFMTLVDLATPVVPEEAGRQDPFAPLIGTSAK